MQKVLQQMMILRNTRTRIRTDGQLLHFLCPRRTQDSVVVDVAFLLCKQLATPIVVVRRAGV